MAGPTIVLLFARTVDAFGFQRLSHARDRRFRLRERGAGSERQDGARGGQNSYHRTPPPLHAGSLYQLQPSFNDSP